MTDLSPAAQDIVNAAVESGGGYGRATPVLYARLAATLRAAANQVVPDQQEPASSPHMGSFISHVQWSQCQAIRTQLLAIAAELETQ